MGQKCRLADAFNSSTVKFCERPVRSRQSVAGRPEAEVRHFKLHGGKLPFAVALKWPEVSANEQCRYCTRMDGVFGIADRNPWLPASLGPLPCGHYHSNLRLRLQ